MSDMAEEIPLFCLRSFMEAVKNGFHVQLGVSLSRNVKTALLQNCICKRKTIFASRFAPWTALHDYVLTFQNLHFDLWYTLFRLQKSVSPEGANLLPVMAGKHLVSEKLISAHSEKHEGCLNFKIRDTHKCAFWKRYLCYKIFYTTSITSTYTKSNAVQGGYDRQNPRRVHWVSEKLLDAHVSSSARAYMVAARKNPRRGSRVL